MISEISLFVLELIGTVAFAVSGALTAIKARFDLFGVVFIGCMTGVGGGILRDVILGIHPPRIFSEFYIVLIGIFTSLTVFAVSYRNRASFDQLRSKIESVNLFFDAVGLAAFSVMGTETAFVHQVSDSMFLSIMLGFFTGVGGGMLRDVFTAAAPSVFRKRIYALASLMGSGLYYLLRKYFDHVILASALSMLSVIALRLLAARYRWKLPRIRLEEQKQSFEEGEENKMPKKVDN